MPHGNLINGVHFVSRVSWRGSIRPRVQIIRPCPPKSGERLRCGHRRSGRLLLKRNWTSQYSISQRERWKTLVSALAHAILGVLVFVLVIVEYRFVCTLWGKPARVSFPVDEQEIQLSPTRTVEASTERSPLESFSERDPLTGLYNRLYVTDILSKVFTNGILGDLSLGLIILHVDEVGETGEVASVADAQLVDAGRSIQEILCRGDIAARWGGNEFLILYPGVTYDEAYTITEYVAENLTYSYARSFSKLGALFSVVSCDEVEARGEHGVEWLLSLLDARLHDPDHTNLGLEREEQNTL
jgi:diguanylate cyclase (GGDEF)-like protein